MTDDSTSEDAVAWTTRETEIEYANPGFGVRRDDVTLPDGTETDYHYVDEPPAAVILPFTSSGEVVLIEEWRQAVGRVNRGVPAGTLERADGGDEAPWFDLDAAFESPERAARRELGEETGYEAGNLAHLTSVEPSNGVADSVHHHFLARGCEPSGTQRLDDDESIRVTTADFDDLRAAVRDGDVRDGRTVIAVLQLLASDHAVPTA
ncbi:NUDIX hydrolase [Halobaculum sp. MBLA0147]|uniref:NUDIX hydrolase n=1 Tax=Halobaculum sp. MBLA0147 TaxID=3079934 RepID=UPI00352437D8